MSLRDRLLRRHGTGYIPDVPDSRDRDFDRLALASSSLPVAASLLPHHKQRRNQHYLSSCVGEKISIAMAICESVAGLPHDPPSSLFPYYYGRYNDGGRPVFDNGSRPRWVLEAGRHLGICAERYWPFDLSAVNRQPLPGAYMRANPRAGGEYVRCFDRGDALILAMRAAIAARLPVIGGAEVDQLYLLDVGPSTIGKPDPYHIAGRHMKCWIAYRYDPLYGWCFLEANSYGAGWRDDGCVWESQDYVETAADVTVMRGWKRLQGASDAGIVV